MKRIIRRLMALMLCAMLALASPLAAIAEDVLPVFYARVELAVEDGVMAFDVQQTTDSQGETVYWLDTSAFDEDTLNRLIEAGQFVLLGENGEYLTQLALGDVIAAGEPAYFGDPFGLGLTYVFMAASMSMPASPEELEAVLSGETAGDGWDDNAG
ncbi:MAG: hypothetical protein Q4F18_14365, partial [Clostridia bacterium]|nr:hypothetical protein [Clostridia bacterium]